MVKCVVMFSGGLDSVIAVHLLKEQGIEVTALHFVLPFDSGLGFEHVSIKKYAESLDVSLRVEEEGEEFLAMISDPRYGYGKHSNPCIDCRIHRLEKARKIMEEIGASFIATGEVVGQRPMSQRMECLGLVEKRAGLDGFLLRPLSALLLEPTIPEKEGAVDRNKLLAIHGRGRKEQLAYAKEHNLKHGTPAGGCVLTHKEVSDRFLDLRQKQKAMSLNDFKLLAYGRHFRIGELGRIVVGRDQGENEILEQLITTNDFVFEMADITGPTGIGRGTFTEEELLKAASLFARYSKDREKEKTSVKIFSGGTDRLVEVTPLQDDECVSMRI